jgi:hypothetical protein
MNKNFASVAVLPLGLNNCFVDNFIETLSQHVYVKKITKKDSNEEFDVIIQKDDTLDVSSSKSIIFNSANKCLAETFTTRIFYPNSDNDYNTFYKFCVCVFLEWQIPIRSNNTIVELL